MSNNAYFLTQQESLSNFKDGECESKAWGNYNDPTQFDPETDKLVTNGGDKKKAARSASVYDKLKPKKANYRAYAQTANFNAIVGGAAGYLTGAIGGQVLGQKAAEDRAAQRRSEGIEDDAWANVGRSNTYGAIGGMGGAIAGGMIGTGLGYAMGGSGMPKYRRMGR